MFVFNARAKIKPQHSHSIRGFYFCDKAEDGQNNGFAKPSINAIIGIAVINQKMEDIVNDIITKMESNIPVIVKIIGTFSHDRL